MSNSRRFVSLYRLYEIFSLALKEPFKTLANMSIKVTPHQTTSNKYVQRSIVRENIKRINEATSHHDFSNLIYQHRRDILSVKDKQVSILTKLNKEIAKIEQVSFAFGGFASPF